MTVSLIVFIVLCYFTIVQLVKKICPTFKFYQLIKYKGKKANKTKDKKKCSTDLNSHQNDRHKEKEKIARFSPCQNLNEFVL